jgi:ABC-2 type transport system permease protein
MMSNSIESVSRPYKLSFGKVLHAEWIKLFTLRSTWWILSATVVINIGVCSIFAVALKYAESQIVNNPQVIASAGETNLGAPGSLGMLSAQMTEACAFIGQLVFIILSILVITNEYSSGMIRSTFTVAPHRIEVMVSKMIVIAIMCIVIFAISLFAGWGIGYSILHGSTMIDLTITSHLSLRIMGGFIIEMILVALFCFGLGTWIRSTAGGIGAAIGIVLILPMILNVIVGFISNSDKPTGWRKWLIDGSQFLPTNAGSVITSPQAAANAILGPWQGIGVLGAWTVLSLIISFVMTVRRDV